MNRIFPEQLASNLNSHLAKVYFLVGTDPLLLSESEDLIHQAALLQGFDEKNQIIIDTNTDWSALIEASQSMGLFFNKQIFILNLPENLTALLLFFTLVTASKIINENHYQNTGIGSV